jgi:type IV pilus assembly protein PilM
MATHIGLDIGSSAVRAVQVDFGRGVPTLERLGQVMLPPGAIRDGEIIDADVVVKALKELWGTYRFKSRKVALGLANQQVIVRQIELPYMPDSELRASLQFQVQDHLPIAVDDAILDYYPLGTVEGPDGEQLTRLLLVAAQQEMVSSQLDVVQRAKLEPIGLDLDAFAALRSVAHTSEFEVEEAGELVIDMGSAVTNILVHRGGLPHFVRILVRGGNSITEALVNGLGLEWHEAEAAKAEIGLRANIDADDEVARIIADRTNQFVEEIRGSVDYFLAHVDAIPLGRMVVTGGGSRMPFLVERLAETLRLPPAPAHPMRQLSVARVGLNQDQLVDAEPHMAVAVGLAMGAAE